MPSTKILLVEDDPGHARLIERNLRRAGIKNVIMVIDNGQSAVDYLQAYSDNRETEESLLVLLDLNLPVLDGYQVLKMIKSTEATRKTPVIVLTTTDLPQEVARCYELGCNIFVTKPVQYDDFCAAVHNLGLILSIAKLP
jgi:CheY-like chemotaxis protein